MWPFRRAPEVQRLEARGEAQALIQALSHAEVSGEAAAALGRMNAPGVTAALLEALRSGVPLAARALGHRGRRAALSPDELPAITAALVQGLGSPDAALHQECRAALVALSATEPLAEALREAPLPQVRALALRALVELRPPTLDALLTAALHDPDPALRNLAQGLGARPPTTPVEARLRALGDADQTTRYSALLELIHAGATLPEADRIALAGGVQRLIRDPEPTLRAAAARALAELGPSARSAGPALAHALEDPDAEARRAAAVALGHVGAHEAIPALRGALRRGEAEAARALGQLSAREAREDLITALDDPRVGAVAAEALGAIGDPAAIPAIEAWLARAPAPEGPDGDPDPRAFAEAALTRLRARPRPL